MSALERRYAKALLDSALEKKNVEEVSNNFSFLMDCCEADSMIYDVFLNPQIPMQEKKKIISAAFSQQVNELLLKFIFLLLDKSRIKNLSVIYDEFIKMSDETQGIVTLNIISAFSLEKDQIEILKTKFQKEYNAKKINLNLTLDPSMIGGIKVQVLDKISDSTVKNRLKMLHKHLTTNFA